ncbi:NHLP leader peptide family RiPP precursor [Pelotomaculum propionicicum]|uniref:Nitrile hydratase alpha/Thiocyanate hydrolase gamma domain-containing protein n=1 Tax=Pelotomaculum propionicicum TaxID=258475 RepID=A0A4Y7RVZ4_9FIRM|nr:NHLP leader peptide family RiPP precursor [Pelotomaculum propionicicum]TEB13164.1 hypothetical protein Pmgp_00460 [Pelotomaculum propionicicum]
MTGNEKKPMNRKELKEQIIKKAQVDREFKKALVENPKGAIGRLGVQLPAEVEVKVVEESTEVVYLVLPANPDELTDEQLDNVTGGNGDVEYSYEEVPITCPDRSNTMKIPR